MQMTEQETRFLARRARLVRAWRYVGPVLVCGLIGFGGWLLWFAPMLANPVAVLSRLESDTMLASTIIVSAAILPIVVMLSLLLALVMILLVFTAFSNERRYLSIIGKLTECCE